MQRFRRLDWNPARIGSSRVVFSDPDLSCMPRDEILQDLARVRRLGGSSGKVPKMAFDIEPCVGAKNLAWESIDSGLEAGPAAKVYKKSKYLFEALPLIHCFCSLYDIVAGSNTERQLSTIPVSTDSRGLTSIPDPVPGVEQCLLQVQRRIIVHQVKICKQLIHY